MNDANNGDFRRLAEAAVRDMREMNARSANNKAPLEKNREATERENREKHANPNAKAVPPQNKALPTSNGFTADGDTALLLGLLLILMNENTDRLLLLALIYILM